MKKLLVGLLAFTSTATLAEPNVTGTCGWIKRINNNIAVDQSIEVVLKNAGVFIEMEGYSFSTLYTPLDKKAKYLIRNTKANLIYSQLTQLNTAKLADAPVCIAVSIDGLIIKEVIGIGKATIEEAHADTISKL